MDIDSNINTNQNQFLDWKTFTLYLSQFYLSMVSISLFQRFYLFFSFFQRNSFEEYRLRFQSDKYINEENLCKEDQYSSNEIRVRTSFIERRKKNLFSKKFLNDVENGDEREKIVHKLIELRRNKEEEIRLRQDEIQIINDLILFINQYQQENNQGLFKQRQ